MSGGRKKLSPLPMPRLISVAEEARLKAAGEWPPPDPAAPPPTAADEPRPDDPDVRIVPPGGGRKRMPRLMLEANIAAFYERLRAPPPWEVERTARKKAEAEAAAHARLSGGRTDKDEGG